jgi:hypothetical protein
MPEKFDQPFFTLPEILANWAGRFVNNGKFVKITEAQSTSFR